MDKPLWPGWKAALVTFGFLMLVMMVVAGVYAAGSATSDPQAAGEKIGRDFGPVIFLAPIVAYIVQKVRIDSARAKAKRKAEQEQPKVA